MKTHRLVLPADLNHYGFLFGGRLLSWVDEACWIAASLDFPKHQFVTIGMDKVEFRHSVREGTILTIHCKKFRTGTSSVTYEVRVYNQKNSDENEIFRTRVTYVSVDDAGNKRSINGK